MPYSDLLSVDAANLKKQAVLGVQWSIGARVGQQIAHIVLTIILARLLLPEDFGAVGMIAIFIGFANLLADMGFATALVQRKEITDIHVNSIFWLNLGAGLILAVALFFCAPLIARFYDLPLLVSLTQALSLTFIFSAPSVVPAAMLQRKMAFRQLSITSITGTLFAGLVAVILAYLGAGVWSLVVQSLLKSLISTILNIWWARWHPQWHLSFRAIGDLLRFTLNLLGFNFINYWARNADNMLIGRFFGSEQLGYYGQAYTLMLLPISEIVGVIARVMFPALSSIQDDTTRIKRIYLRVVGVIALMICPIMIGLAVTAEPFVLTVFGEKWVALIPLLRILLWVGLLQAFMNPTGWLYMSTGRTDWMFWWGIYSSITLIASIFIGIAFGSILTVAICYAIINIINFMPCIAIPGRLVDLAFKEVVSAIAEPLIGALIMAGCVMISNRLMPENWSVAVTLVVQVLVGITAYTTFLMMRQPQSWLEFVDILRSQIKELRQQTAVSSDG